MLQRVVMNRRLAEAIKGVSGFTAADHLISSAITQAWDRPQQPEARGAD